MSPEPADNGTLAEADAKPSLSERLDASEKEVRRLQDIVDSLLAAIEPAE